jgi:single-strand DNA-binding protein
MLRRPEMANEAYVSLIGFVATQPKKGLTKGGSVSLSMRVGWTPRALDRATGVWSDLPSSFVSVQCYRKVAEHAAVCLRRGDPVVLRGTLRVREYTDQAGQRRSSVEVQADSIGHDMSRGISNYSKLPARAELTAEQYEQSLVAADRTPLPGDLPAPTPDGTQEAERDASEDSRQTDDADGGYGDAADAELAVDEEYDEPAAGDVLAIADDALEAVRA